MLHIVDLGAHSSRHLLAHLWRDVDVKPFRAKMRTSIMHITSFDIGTA